MRDIELYRHLLGLQSPWTITEVKLELEEQRVHIWVDHPGATLFPCPECGVLAPVYDHSEERVWRHLDSCQFTTHLHARPPRVCCPEHGVRQASMPWSEGHSRFTALFERFAIDVLQETDVLGATRILRVSWDEAWRILDRAVERGLLAKQARVCRRIGVDEKAAAKGHDYITVVCDLESGTVEHVALDRKKESLDSYFQGLSSEQLAGIEAVAMDMWKPYIQSTKAHVPDAAEKIVFDRYHIMTHMGGAVDAVRKRENRDLSAEGKDTLKGSKYLWLYAGENLPERHRERFERLKALHLKTGRAWAIKEALRELWRFRRRGWAKRHWDRWYFWATHSRLKPVVKAAQTIKRHLPNIMTFFSHRITNAASEALNSKIQRIKKMACGFRNREHFKTAIYFHSGGLELYPKVTHAKPG